MLSRAPHSQSGMSAFPLRYCPGRVIFDAVEHPEGVADGFTGAIDDGHKARVQLRAALLIGTVKHLIDHRYLSFKVPAGGRR